MRSETPRAPMAPEAPGPRKVGKSLTTFHARAQSLFKKTPTTIAAADTIGKVTDVFPEYKYKDVYYNGGRAQNVNYNAWQGQYDSSLVSPNANGMSLNVRSIFLRLSSFLLGLLYVLSLWVCKQKIISIPILRVAGCVDVDKHCQLYASQGFCREPFTARAMRTLCRRSCDLCQT